MAAKGVIFTEAHANASLCTPSKYDNGWDAFHSELAAHGFWGFHLQVIEPEQETQATVLKKTGFITACIGKWHLGVGR